MAAKTPTTNLEMELNRMEQWLDDLVVTCERLNEENYALRKQNEALSKSNSDLKQNGDQARSRVESIIGKLRAMENSV